MFWGENYLLKQKSIDHAYTGRKTDEYFVVTMVTVVVKTSVSDK